MADEHPAERATLRDGAEVLLRPIRPGETEVDHHDDEPCQRLLSMAARRLAGIAQRTPPDREDD